MTTVGVPRRPRETLLGPLVALALGAVVVFFARWGPDWPAQEFRAWVAAHEGLGAWTNRWYGGQALPSYSVLYPPLAKVLGAGLTGLLATVGATWAAAGLAPAGRWRARAFQVGVAVSLTQNLLIGQVPFLVAVVFAVLAVRGVADARPVWAIVALAALTSLASPMAGFFLIVAAPALGLAWGRRRALGLLAGLAGPAVAAVVGGAGGWFPCKWQTLAGIVIFCAVLAVVARHSTALRCFALCYLITGVVLFAVPNPIGGNVSRLGKLIVVPLACHLLFTGGRARHVLGVAAVLLAVAWPTVPFATSMSRGFSDPSQHRGYYAGLTSFLKTQDARSGRIEIPFTREHWEALWVAQSFPIARGWERQTDLLYNRVLYAPLTPDRYRRWLQDNSVSLVALPNVPIDYGGQAEADLLGSSPTYLQPVWSDAHWRVWRVLGARPIVTGPATLTELGPSSVVLDFARAGVATVRIRASSLWHVRSGAACVATSGGWLQIRATHPGRVALDASITGDLVTSASRCAT